jgi:hypothetical protein
MLAAVFKWWVYWEVWSMPMWLAEHVSLMMLLADGRAALV